MTVEKALKSKNLVIEQFKKCFEDTQRKIEKEIKKADQPKAKKKRSKSCISKIGEQVFSWKEHPREKSKESNDRGKGAIDNFDALSGSFNKRKKEDSCIGELNNLRKDIQMEIQRERHNVVTPSAAKPSHPQTTKNQDKLGGRKQSESAVS